MICTSCKAGIEEDSSFCRHCGASVQSKATSPDLLHQQPSVPEPSPSPRTEESTIILVVIAGFGIAALIAMAWSLFGGLDFSGAGAAKDAVRQTMLDPGGAQFRNVKPCTGDRTVIRGEVKGKNSFGAYTGFKLFHYAEHQLAFPGDPASESLMNRCYRDLHTQPPPAATRKNVLEFNEQS